MHQLQEISVSSCLGKIKVSQKIDLFSVVFGPPFWTPFLSILSTHPIHTLMPKSCFEMILFRSFFRASLFLIWLVKLHSLIAIPTLSAGFPFDVFAFLIHDFCHGLSRANRFTQFVFLPWSDSRICTVFELFFSPPPIWNQSVR